MKMFKQRLIGAEAPRRAFLTGANPFVLQADRLLDIAQRIGRYFPAVQTIGCFARVTRWETRVLSSSYFSSSPASDQFPPWSSWYTSAP